MSHHGIEGCAQKALNEQILLDPLEEQFDLPTFFVQLSDRCRREIQRIDQKLIGDAGLLVQVANLAIGAGNPLAFDFLIAQYARAFASPAQRTGSRHRITFRVRDKEDTVCGQFLIPGIISITPVEHNVRPSGQFEFPGDVDFMLLACCHVDESGQVAVGIQADMKLCRTFAFTVLGPREQRQRQIHQGGINQVDLALKV